MFHCFQKVKRNKFQIYPKIGTHQAQRQDFVADTVSLLCVVPDQHVHLFGGIRIRNLFFGSIFNDCLA